MSSFKNLHYSTVNEHESSSALILTDRRRADTDTDVPKYKPCKIKHLDGECQLFPSCKIAMNLLKNKDFKTLRTMHCGFEGKRPKVCCPITTNDDVPSTIGTTQTTTVQYTNDTDAEKDLVAKAPETIQPQVKPDVLPNRNDCGLVTKGDNTYKGVLTAIGEFPWLARIKYYNPTKNIEMFVCSGSLITDRFVVSAAHCIGVYKVIGVRLGEWNTKTNIDCEDGFCSDPVVDVIVDKIFVYPKYERENLTSGDIALLRMERKVAFTDFVRPVCLPTSPVVAKRDYNMDSPYTTAGWSLTEFGQDSVLKLKRTLDSIPYYSCQRTIPLLPKKYPAGIICAGGKPGELSCRGDSGGPIFKIVAENHKNNWYLFGITSYGPVKCVSTGKPGIYTRVTAYMDWIIQTVTDNSVK